MRISYGDYQLHTIPPGLAIEVPVKPIDGQKNRGPLFKERRRDQDQEKGKGDASSPVQWVRSVT